MAPVFLDSTTLDDRINGVPKPSKSQPEVELVLNERCETLLFLIEALDAPSTIKNENPDVQIQRILHLAWVITVRAFVSSTTLYVGQHYPEDRCFIGATKDPTGVTSQIHVDTYKTVKDLFTQIINNLSTTSSEIRLDSLSETVETRGLYDTRIIYQRKPFSGSENDRTARMARSQTCCPYLIDSVLPASGLQLYIRRTASNYLSVRLDGGIASKDSSLATSLLHSFDTALSSIASQPNQSISTVDLCSTHDREHIRNFTRSLSPPQDALLHDLCLRHATTTPNAFAVRSWDGDLTYLQLHDYVCQLAHWLVAQGVTPGVFVACTFYKSTWAIVARLAILMAGGAYLCVDACDPPPYLKSVLDRTRIRIMLASTGFAQQYADQVDVLLKSPVMPSDPCVVLFTSGSTGSPKGIIQEHRSYASALTDYIRVMGMGPHSRLFQFDAYAFDISNNDLLAPLIAGGCCFVPTRSLTIEAFMSDLNDLEANIMFVTPSVAVEMDPERVPTLQTMCIGGEPLSDSVLKKWLGRVRVINQYGMGEVASLCAYNSNLQLGRGAAVGRPASGSIWIVSPDTPDRLMPIGAVGELLIEGPHIARGYLDHVSGKSESFLSTPPSWMKHVHPDRPSHRLYRSGDLGRYNHDGTIELIGRKDSMLKLDGARVEAGQVEFVIRKHLSAGDIALVDILGTADGVSERILAVYLYLSSNPMNFESGSVEEMEFRPIMQRRSVSCLTQTISNDVRENLPRYYVPSLFLLIDRVPRTKSKKTDRRKLQMLGQAYYMAHREELKDIIVWPGWG
ncbi:uncharacterized protein N7496_002025 [Penicillium cataractarum]|uniref:AMP-dependent synthetase/ligase domain-containing protein n=1 Tax=Penicillium cataractarum TaxID=2100454 RepID=A0A9W9VX12_9EURO|nr:uncharacterized protein N7496_002025 [Penicillium cataractarum]KAJ5390957.1 hypothetical protein N7496_002025 [Penicillium cataractarum]